MTLNDKNIMTDEEFNLLRDLINREFGIILKGDKRLTLHTKISHRLPILGLKSYKEYYDFIIENPTKEELFNLASHITNNETYFFREKTQLDVFFEILKDVKKERLKKNQNTLRILSLACSSGEEMYSLNIILQDSGLFLWDWDVKIIGIDIDKTALKKARSALYTKNSFRQNGNMESIERYFTIDNEKFALKPLYRKNTEFIHGNILDSNSFIDITDVDIIFCRNTLIYMDDIAIRRIANNLYNCLSDSGYLFIGSAESLIQKTNLFFPEYNNGIIVYRKKIQDA
jgi:chemotaxis protein methyltransferase CheR